MYFFVLFFFLNSSQVAKVFLAKLKQGWGNNLDRKDEFWKDPQLFVLFQEWRCMH